MPICIDCGSIYDEIQAACPTCGQTIQVVCPSCNQSNRLFKLAGIKANPDLQDPALLEKLSFIPKPVPPQINGVLTVLGVLLMFASLFALVRIHTSTSPLIFALCMVFAVVCFLKARVNKKQANTYLAEVQKWRDAKDRWEQQYYCADCDAVFLPGQDASAPADRMAEYLPKTQ
jgi:hypothetical protein